jgi:hypothetical protein
MAVNGDIRRPSENKFDLATFVLAATIGGSAAAALAGVLAPAFLLTPFFLGALVGTIAIRHPIRAAVGIALLGLAWFVVESDLTASSAPAVGGAIAFAYFTPLMSLGALCTATVRRGLRGASAPREVLP